MIRATKISVLTVILLPVVFVGTVYPYGQLNSENSSGIVIGEAASTNS